jgi:hypothetical protein
LFPGGAGGISWQDDNWRDTFIGDAIENFEHGLQQLWQVGSFEVRHYRYAVTRKDAILERREFK